MAENKPLTVLVIGYGRSDITFLNRLMRGLADRRIKILVAATRSQSFRSKVHDSIRILRIPPLKSDPFSQSFRLIHLLISALFSKRLGWLLSQVRKHARLKNKLGTFFRYAPFCLASFDVVYFPWNSTAITYRGIFDLGKPVVISCRGSQVNILPHLPDQEKYINGLRYTLKKAAAVHCVSAAIQREAQNYGLHPQKSVIIRPAVDPQTFQPPADRPQQARLRCLTTGSLIWRKNVETMLMAIKKLLDQGVDTELHILGRGPMEQNLRFTIEDLGLAERVQMHGRVPPEEVLRHLQGSDIFILSSLSEGISNAVLEAMSCGLPVVTTDCGGMAEAITNGVEGFLVPLRDSEAMARAIAKLADKPDLRMRMGLAGRERVVNDFKLEDQISAFITMFSSVVMK